MKMNNKSIFEYKDYREFLKDSYVFRKSKDNKFSYRYFSRLTGFKSPSALRDVIKGRTGLKESGIRRFAKALGLVADEVDFFRNLVHFNQAKTSDEKQAYAAQILKSKSYQKIHPLNEAQFQCCAYWYIIPIREIVGTRGFDEDPEWIAKKLKPAISIEDAKRALDVLLRLGMIKRNENGILVQSESVIATADEVSSSSIIKFHKEMLRKSSHAIDRYPRDLRDISALTLRLPLNEVSKIKEMIQKFRKDLVEALNTFDGPSRIYQLNLQLFPITELLDIEEKKT
jgi:uncharacterized protein (TIGR02147 family)